MAQNSFGDSILRKIKKQGFEIRVVQSRDPDTRNYPYCEIEFDNGGYWCATLEEMVEFAGDLKIMTAYQRRFMKFFHNKRR